MNLRDSHQRSISAVPSVTPKRVRARSVSAVQIEVIWEAIPAIPERVLGYEVCYDSLQNLFFLLLLSNNMIIELFPVACLSPHNHPFIVLIISFFSLFFFLLLLYLLVYLCRDFVLRVIISGGDPNT